MCGLAGEGRAACGPSGGGTILCGLAVEGRAACGPSGGGTILCDLAVEGRAVCEALRLVCYESKMLPGSWAGALVAVAALGLPL